MKLIAIMMQIILGLVFEGYLMFLWCKYFVLLSKSNPEDSIYGVITIFSILGAIALIIVLLVNTFEYLEQNFTINLNKD